MKKLSSSIARSLVSIDTRYLPFADVASPDLPLKRLLRLSLFQITVGMAGVLVLGTLNRVMIVELGVPAWLVALMVAIPLILAPFRTVIGFKSDHHQSVLGWRRVPYIWMGTMLQFGGLSIMPFALLLLSEPSMGPNVIGQIGAAIAFLLVGAGMHTAQTVGLALAADMAPEPARPRVVAMMCSMMVVGMVVSAVVFSSLLAEFTPKRLIEVVQGAAFVTMFLNSIALWKQEPRNPERAQDKGPVPKFSDAWREFLAADPRALRRLAVVGIGAFGFSMQDVLLEPFGGQVLHLPVAVTTLMFSLFAIGGVTGYVLTARRLANGMNPHRLATVGIFAGLVALSSLILSAPLLSVPLFGLGTLLIGFGTGLFVASTLSDSMGQAKHGDSGLALGVWGAVQASAAGLAIAFGGVLRDVVSGYAISGAFGETFAVPATGYVVVYSLEIVLLLAALVVILPLVRAQGRGAAQR